MDLHPHRTTFKHLPWDATYVFSVHTLADGKAGREWQRQISPSQLVLSILPLPQLFSLRAFVTDTHRHTTAEKPLSLLKVVTNVLLPTTMCEDMGRFCCSIDSIHLEEKHLHFPNLFREIEVCICCIPLLVAFFLYFSCNSWLIFLYPSVLSK